MGLDKFGRSSERVNDRKGLRGQPGLGFNWTADGQFDIQNHRLCNVLAPVDDHDCVNKTYLEGTMGGVWQRLNEVTVSIKDSKDLMLPLVRRETKISIDKYNNEQGEKLKWINELIRSNVQSINLLKDRLDNLESKNKTSHNVHQ